MRPARGSNSAPEHIYPPPALVQEPRSIDKIAEIDKHVACANSGLAADSRTLIEHARVETQNHRFTYNEPMPVESCAQSLCDLALQFSQGDVEDRMVRSCKLIYIVLVQHARALLLAISARRHLHTCLMIVLEQESRIVFRCSAPDCPN